MEDDKEGNHTAWMAYVLVMLMIVTRVNDIG